MERLVELLNEYEKEKGGRNLNEFEVSQTLDSLNYLRLFIQWLVENNKIDFSIIPNKIKGIWIPMKINWEIKYWFDSSDYCWLLILLSIQDNPIEFLISVLK